MDFDDFTENEISEKAYFENLNKTLDAFAADLSDKQGLKSNTVHRHVNRLGFFAESFLFRKDVALQHMHPEDIIDFLGEYYIRKVLDSNKSDISPYLTAFKKYAKFAYEKGYIDKDDFDEMKMICKQKDYFLHRFDTYFSTDNLEAWFFDNNLYVYLDEQEEADEALENSDEMFDVDANFVQVVKEQNLETPMAVSAFTAFLEKIQNENSVKLTKARQHITRNFWKELDQLLGMALFQKPTLNQEDISLYHYFYLLGKHANLYRIDGDKLIPTKRLASFQKLSQEEKYVFMLDGLWNQLSWGNIQPSNVGGRIEVTQSRRSSLAATFSRFPVGEQVHFRDSKLGLKLINQTFFGGIVGSGGHFFWYIMPVLEYFGLFDLKYEWQERKYSSSYVIVSAVLKEMGLVTFHHLKKMDDTLPESASPDMLSDILIQMRNQPVVKNEKAGRNDPCPCGSGKKYKRCCM